MRLARWLIAPESRPASLALAWAAVAAIAVADDLTGKELSLAAFYLYPIILATWRGGRAWGFAISTSAAALVVAVAAHVGNPFSRPAFLYLYAAGILVSFLVVTEAVAQLRRALDEKVEG
jgi:hypothetical protein